MDIFLAWSLVGQAVDKPWVGMKVEDNGRVIREEASVFFVCHAVGMFAVRDKFEQIDDIHESDFELGKDFA
jgi:hypothetical protein